MVMQLTVAADVYAELAPKYEAAKPELRQLQAAEKVLKEHFKRTKKRSFAGKVGCKFGTMTVFSKAKAKELLGKRAATCEETIVTASLYPLQGTADVAVDDDG